MTKAAGTAVLLAAAVASLIHSPNAAAAPEHDFCRAMSNVGYPSDCATLAGLAKDACAQFDRGADVSTIAQQLDLATKDQMLSNFIVAAAPLYFCAQHDDKT